MAQVSWPWLTPGSLNSSAAPWDHQMGRLHIIRRYRVTHVTKATNKSSHAPQLLRGNSSSSRVTFDALHMHLQTGLVSGVVASGKIPGDQRGRKSPVECGETGKLNSMQTEVVESEESGWGEGDSGWGWGGGGGARPVISSSSVCCAQITLGHFFNMRDGRVYFLWKTLFW